MMHHVVRLVWFYVRLIKVPQTGLLLFTAVGGFRSGSGNIDLAPALTATLGMLFVISGTTALNMVFDRDIDYIMERTKMRPIPTGKVSPESATIFGVLLILGGSILNIRVSILFATVVAAGMFFDFVIYTIWLKRRSPWSIIFGGLAGGMPILAGRSLDIGSIDLIGLLLALSILFWIPTHILTLTMNHSRDYKLAGVPTFPNVFGYANAHYFIAISNIVSASIILYVFQLLKVSVVGVFVCTIGSLVLLAFSAQTVINPNKKTHFSLFRFASVYIGGVMLILVL